MAKARLEATIGLKTKKFRRGLAKVRRMAQSLNRRVFQPLAKIGKRLFQGIAVGASAAAAGIVASARAAEEFNKQIGQISTLTDIALPTLKRQVRELSAEFGVAKEELTKGLYDALSAGVPKENVFEFMKVASKAAIAGAATTAEAVDVLTTTLNAFKIPAEDAAKVADVLFTTVRLGKTTLPEIAASFAQVAPLAKASGVEFEQVAGAIATLTKQGTPTAQAMTQIRGAIIAMNRELGDGWADSMTLAEGMEAMRKKAGGSEKKLKDLTGRVEGMLAILGMTGENAAGAAEDFNEMASAAGAADSAFGKMKDINRLQKLIMSAQNVLISFGDTITKVLGPSIDELRVNVARFAESDRLRKWAEKTGSAIKKVADVIRSLFAGGEARSLALGGVQKILIGSWQKAANAAIDLLSKAIPRLGMALGTAAKEAFKMSDLSIAMEALKTGKQTSDIRRERQLAIAKSVEDILGSDGPDDSDNLIAEGHKDLRMAAEKMAVASKVQARIQEVLESARADAEDLPVDALSKLFDAAGVGDGGGGAGGGIIDKADAAFGPLRRIGANLINKGALGAGQNREQKKLTLAERNAKAAEATRLLLAENLPKLANNNGRF